MDEHNETSFSLLIHELLFTHLQHTFDHVTLGLSHQAKAIEVMNSEMIIEQAREYLKRGFICVLINL